MTSRIANDRFGYAGSMKVIGYVRVSTDEQADSGAGMEAQRAAIEQECSRRGWKLERIEEDTASGRSMTGRTGLARALEALEEEGGRDRRSLEAVETGGAEALIVAKLDRLSRSLLDFASLMQRAQRKGWALVALDLGVDTTTPQGEMMASVLAVFAQFERRLIGQRTRDALAVKRAQGVRLGRPPVVCLELRDRLKQLRSEGQSYRAIASTLNAEGVPTAHGGQAWHPTTVSRIVRDET